MLPLSLAGWITQASSFTSLGLSFLIHKMGLIILSLRAAVTCTRMSVKWPAPCLACSRRSINAV